MQKHAWWSLFVRCGDFDDSDDDIDDDDYDEDDEDVGDDEKNLAGSQAPSVVCGVVQHNVG